MQIIDSHIHLSPIASFDACAQENGVDLSPRGYARECAENQVTAIALGVEETAGNAMPDKTCHALMGIDFESYPDHPYALGINPHTFDRNAISELEQRLQNDPHLVGLKIYGGYYHFYLTDPVYAPAFELAQTYDVPVVFHSGDTFSSAALLKYAHPLIGDEVAKRYPDVDLILAHMGNPWVIDGAEVAYRNPNVYVDIAGLYVGKNLQRVKSDERILDYHRLALELIHGYDKVLYGSDWPLVPMADYIAFIQQLVPEQHWPAVFHDNAARLFKRLNIR